MGWKYAPKLLHHFFPSFSLTVFFYPFFPPLVSPSPAPLFSFLYLCQWMPQTKQQRDHTKRWQSVEDQAPYGEHINSKACGTHLRRASSHLHMPLICIFTKKKAPLAFPHQQNPSPRPHQHTPAWLRKGSRAANVCWLRPHMHIQMIHKYTQMHKINFCTCCIQMCNGRVNRNQKES